jgi:flavorubredoxin
MGAVEIKPGIYWIGAIDWAIRDFHGYVTPNGTTYNNYLILDRHVTLVDTVKHEFCHYTLDNIKSLTDPAGIENIVINHIENASHKHGGDHGTAPNALIPSQRGKRG